MNTARKKLVIIAQIAPRQIGSYERYHFGVVRAMEAQGWEILSAFSGPLSEPVRDHFGLKPTDCALDLGDATTGPSRDAWINRLRRERPDVVWIHFFATTGEFARQLRQALPNSWVVVTDHISRGRVQRNLVRKIAHDLRRWVTQAWIDRHIAVSGFVADRLVASDKVPRHKVQLIYNGVDVNSFEVATAAPKEDYLITICYMRPEKGVGVLLQALAILRRSGVEPRCLIVGDGPKLAEYTETARQANLSRVEFLGHRNDVAELLPQAMGTVVPSVWPEAFSFVAAESQAAGVPVVASAVGGLKEVVEDNVTGYLIPPNDPEALASAISRLLFEPDTRAALGRAGRNRVERLFDLNDKIRETTEFFESLIAQDRPRRGRSQA